MSAKVESQKYIQRLVRVLSEKEKIIDELRRKSKQGNDCKSMETRINSCIHQQKLRAELEIVREQVKTLVSKMNKMEEHILQLSLDLKEEMTLNYSLQEELRSCRNNQEQMKRNHYQSLKIKQIQFSEQIQLSSLKSQKINDLEQKIKRLESQSLQMNFNLDKMKKQCDEYIINDRNIRQMIDGLYKLTEINQQTQDLFRYGENKSKQLKLNDKIEAIREYIENIGRSSSDVLDQTLEGISIIMHSVQEKLGEINCLTERQNIKEDCINRDKVSSKTVPSKDKKSLAQSPFCDQNDPKTEFSLE